MVKINILNNPEKYNNKQIINYLNSKGIKGVSRMSRANLIKIVKDLSMTAPMLRKKYSLKSRVTKTKAIKDIINDLKIKKIDKEIDENEQLNREVDEMMIGVEEEVRKQEVADMMERYLAEAKISFQKDIESLNKAKRYIKELDKPKFTAEMMGKEIEEMREKDRLLNVERGIAKTKSLNINESFRFDEILRMLRRRRVINTKKGLIIQSPVIDISNIHTWEDLVTNEDIQKVEREFKSFLKVAHNALFSDNSIIRADIKILYATEVEDYDKLPIEQRRLRYGYKLKYSSGRRDDNGKLVGTFFGRGLDMKKFIISVDEQAHSDFTMVKLGYIISFATRGREINENKLRELKAFKPSSNRKYHELTSGSTTESKICIYESFLDITEKVSLKYMRKNNERNYVLDTMLKAEGKEIEICVKNGKLIESLELLTKKYDNEILIVFYVDKETDEKDLPILISKGKVESLESHDITKYIGKKAMLYEKNIHVAPFLVKKQSELEIKTNSKTNFIMRPKELKVKDIEDRRIKNILGFDTETFLDEVLMCKVFCITVYGKNKGKDIEKKWYGDKNECINGFIEYLNSICTRVDNKKSRPKGKIDNIYLFGFNNSNFDNLFIYDKLHDEDPGTDILFTASSIKKIKYNNIHIFDLNLFYPGSLDSVSKSFGLKINKGVYPYTFPNKNNLDYIGPIPDVKYFKSEDDYNLCLKELNGSEFNLKEITSKYCMMDSRLVYEIAIMHLDQSIQKIGDKYYDVQKCGTGAAIAKKAYNQVFQELDLKQSPDSIIEHERLRYKGGRTEAFKKYFNGNDSGKRLYYGDINSSYPASMTLDMPYEYCKSMIFEDMVMENEDIMDENGYLAKVEYEGNDKDFIPNILVRSDDGSVIAVKNSDYAWHWGIELKEAILNNCKITVRECEFYSPEPVFKEYACYFYEERLKIKKSNPAKAMFFKLLLNSLYGKFGQKTFTKRQIVRDSEDMYKNLGEDNMLMNFTPIGEEKILMEYKTKGEEYHSIGKLVRFSSYIAACSRVRLSKMMRLIGHEHIYYCDTDSIFADVPFPKEYIDDNELGKWKYETAPIIEGMFLAPKVYYYETEEGKSDKKAKGIKGGSIPKEEFKLLVSGIKKRYKQSNTMFYRSFDGIKIEETTRTLRTIYNKRIWDDNNSEAFNNIKQWEDAKTIEKNKNKIIQEFKKDPCIYGL